MLLQISENNHEREVSATIFCNPVSHVDLVFPLKSRESSYRMPAIHGLTAVHGPQNSSFDTLLPYVALVHIRLHVQQWAVYVVSITHARVTFKTNFTVV